LAFKVEVIELKDFESLYHKNFTEDSI